jgi:hypothetical protein
LNASSPLAKDVNGDEQIAGARVAHEPPGKHRRMNVQFNAAEIR